MSWSKASLVALSMVAAVASRGERARACGGGYDWSPTQGGFFDTNLLEVDSNLGYEPYTRGFGVGGCDGCDVKSLAGDWHGYLADSGITDADWQQVMLKATASEIAVMKELASGKNAPAPKGYAQSSVWKIKKGSKGADRLALALPVIELAHRVEPFATFSTYDQNGNERTPRPSAESNDVLADARAALKVAKDPFITQRIAFQIERILYYQRDWNAAVSFFDKTPALLTPSVGLHYRARYYLAGALSHSGHAPRANLELARVHANDPDLAAGAAQDFHPKEEADWRDALAQAKDARDKVALWRLVGITQDGVAAMQEILKLDPKSNLIALLMMRELARVEGADTSAKQDFSKLEAIASAVIAKGGDRPWLMELVLAHAAAIRGDIDTTRTHLARVGKTDDKRVANQARSTLALALANTWRIDAQHEDELARTMGAIAKDYARSGAIRSEVRSRLAKQYEKAGKILDAELLEPGILDPTDPTTGLPVHKSKWSEIPFMKDLVARLGKTTTEFDKFVVDSGITLGGVEQDIAFRYMLDGDFANSQKTFASTTAKSERLHTDPFVMHITDCHDCDHSRYENAPWTHASLVAKLVELDRTASGKTEAAAEASIAIGSVFYNVTWFGNARSVLDGSHQVTYDTHAAEKWFKRAYDTTSNRETKAKAAYLAAKAELGELIGNDPFNSRAQLPVPTTWFGKLKDLNDTKYYKEVLKECSVFAAYSGVKTK